ncbi:MAG: DUF4363 family protein [Oscillospiraceae bacterium]|nr:DUF4363 family protein [Oscillospiraceae bacterium]
MKRIGICIGIFAALFVFASISENYAMNKIKQTGLFVSQAVEARRAGDFESAKENAEFAWEEWRSLSKMSNYVLSDLTIIADVSVSLSRVVTLAQGDDSERFFEECTATILLLKHFKSDNKNLLGNE